MRSLRGSQQPNIVNVRDVDQAAGVAATLQKCPGERLYTKLPGCKYYK